MNSVIIVSSIAIILSIISGVLSFLALAYIIGLKNSTHRIQYIDPTEGRDNSEEINKIMEEDIFKEML